MAEAEIGELAGRPVLILKSGTERTAGRAAQLQNIKVARIIGDTLKSSLGPKGMDKILIDDFGDITITNDGATILDEMDVQHPIAKMMVEVAKTQDKEVGDGTTTAVVLAGELLGKAEELLKKEVHPTIIGTGYRKALDKALEHLESIAIHIDPTDKEAIKKVVMTSLSGKAVREYADYIADLAIDAVLQVARKRKEGYEIDIDDIKVEKKAGASIRDSKLVRGIVLDKEVVHPDMPRRITNAKIALLDCPLEVEKTEFDAKLNITTPEQMRQYMMEEEKMMSDKVNKIVSAGANVVLCQKGIDDYAQFLLARKGVYAVRRVKASDMEKLAKATGGTIITNVDDLEPKHLGEAELVEEVKVEDENWTFISGCRDPRAISILVRGGSDKIVDEAERSIHDALCVARDILIEPKAVAGGGAPEVEIARKLRQEAERLTGREKLAFLCFAESVETIPSTLAENAGLDPIDTLTDLTSAHERGEKWAGVDVFTGKVRDMYELDVLEPLSVKRQALKSACEAAIMILRISDIISAAREEKKPPEEKGAPEEE